MKFTRWNLYIFLYLLIISAIYAMKYKIFETTSEIAFSKILKYNITLKDKKIVDNISSEILSTSVLSVLVRVQKSEDCIKKSIV
jgi:hypothetical protein